MQVVADRYEVRRILGVGGMAVVSLAYDRLLERNVALKVLREDLGWDPEARAWFLREARTAATLSHPGAVTVLDAGERSDGTTWIVLEFVEGETLRERMARGPLTADEAIAVGVAVLETLAAAHEIGVIHRDVKPANVLLPGGDLAAAKLTDFGIARRGDDTLPGSGQIYGTARYLAPELVAGERPTPASDLYAVGVMLYEALAGAPPFDGPTALDVALAHQLHEAPPLAQGRPDLPVALTATITAALAKDATARPAGAQAMASRLGQITAGSR